MRRTHERDKVWHSSGEDTKDTRKQEGRVPSNSSTIFVSQVLHCCKDVPNDVTRHSPEGSSENQTTVQGKGSHSDGGVAPPFVTDSRHDD